MRFCALFCQVPVATGQELVFEQFPYGNGSCTGSVFEYRWPVDSCMPPSGSGQDRYGKVECRDGKLVVLWFAGTTCTGVAEKNEWEAQEGAQEGDCLEGVKITSNPCTATTTSTPASASQGSAALADPASASACLTFSLAFFIVHI